RRPPRYSMVHLCTFSSTLSESCAHFRRSYPPVSCVNRLIVTWAVFRRLIHEVFHSLFHRLGLRVAGQRDHAGPRCEVHQPHAHRLPPGLLYFACPGPDDAPGRSDREHFVVGTDHQRAHQAAAVFDDPRRDDAEAASVAQRVLVGRRALSVPAIGRHHYVFTLADHVHPEELVAVVEPHADHAGGGPAHRPELLVVG